jgi:hypothetical protein
VIVDIESAFLDGILAISWSAESMALHVKTSVLRGEPRILGQGCFPVVTNTLSIPADLKPVAAYEHIQGQN